jgi:uncharacterized protein with beta-barrel porin domain
LLAQSIGGGGGLALVRASTVNLGGGKGNSSPAGAPVSTTVTSAAAIVTRGAASVGIVAQSIGGGGGLAFSAAAATLGGAHGGSNAGAVLVNSNAPISTSGANAYGILAQSVGGGGGAVLSTGDAVNASFKPGVGNAGAVTVNVNASITTTGVGAHGVVAQSVSGGGGLVLDGNTTKLRGGSSGESGLVTVVVAPGVSIRATGANSSAIKTFSSTDPVVEIAAGASVTGGAGASALEFEGPTNELHNNGMVGSADGAAGLAVQTLSGDTMVRNGGTLQGNVRLADQGNNLLHNLAGGTLLAGDLLHLGGAGVLRNEGAIQQAGAAGSLTRIEGSLVQSDSGTLELKIDHANGKAGGIHVTGTAQLAGRLRAVHVNGGEVAPGTVSLGSVVTTGGGLDASALSVASTAMMRYSLSSSGGELQLTSTAAFSPAELPADMQALGAVVGAAQTARRLHFHALTEHLMTLPSVADLQQAYWNLGGAAAGAVSSVSGQLHSGFSRVLAQRAGAAWRASQGGGVAQPDADAGAGAGRPAGRQGSMLGAPGDSAWAQGYGDAQRRGTAPDAPGGDLEAEIRGLALGADRPLSADTVVGLAAAIGSSRFEVSDVLNGRSDTFQLGSYALHQRGPAYAAVALSYGWERVRSTRTLPLLDTRYAADFSVHSLGARGETGYRLGTPTLAVTPYVALQWQHVLTPAYAEQSASRDAVHLALDYGRRRLTTARLELGAQVERQVALVGGLTLTVHGRAGWAALDERRHEVGAAFQTLPGSQFSLGGPSGPGQLGLLSAGATLQLGPLWWLSASTSAEQGGRTQSHAGSATLQARW